MKCIVKCDLVQSAYMQLCVHDLVRREGGREAPGKEARSNNYFSCRIKEALPAGRSFVCMDNRELPQILQQILSSTLT